MTTRPPVRRGLAPAVRETVDAQDYAALLTEIRARIRAAQHTALRVVDKELVGLYWNIGQLVAARRQTEGWGKAVVQQLATDLQTSFPGMGGFSASSLQRMKGFFEVYCDVAKLAPPVREIGWSHNLLVFEHCKDAQGREFYLHMTRKFGWSKNVLAHQIDNQDYEKSLLGQTNFDQALTPAPRARAKLAVKDKYAFDFLELDDRHSERELERVLITRIKDFLRAMDGVFAFLGSQYRLKVDGGEYFTDLLLFHRRLRFLVAIELEIDKFEPEFVGKMRFYLVALGKQIRQDDEDPSIGVILCKEKKRAIVEYVLRGARKPIDVTTHAIAESLSKELQGQLPSPEAIAYLLEMPQPRPLKAGRHDQLARPVITAL